MTRRIVLALLVTLSLVGGLAGPASAAKPHRGAVLGGKSYNAPYGDGWGTKHPSRIFNGGAPSGLVYDITWKKWGNKKARGHGLGSQYKPGGGYYSEPVKVQLIAKKMSRCYRGGPRAYTKLLVRQQVKPHGKFGKWFSWSYTGTICGD